MDIADKTLSIHLDPLIIDQLHHQEKADDPIYFTLVKQYHFRHYEHFHRLDMILSQKVYYQDENQGEITYHMLFIPFLYFLTISTNQSEPSIISVSL